MIASQGGDDAAYRMLLQEVRIWLVAYFSRRLSTAVADDAAQETLLALHQCRKSYKDSGPFLPWLSTIARFKWIDQLRLRRREVALLEDDEIVIEDHGGRILSEILIGIALAELKAPQAEAIRLVKLTGASVEEAARLTGQSASLVKVNVHRGLRRMAERLASEENAQTWADAPAPTGGAPPPYARAVPPAVTKGTTRTSQIGRRRCSP